MEIINNILYFTKDYWIISVLISFFAAFIESFIPAIPLLAIVATSAAINGLVIGFIATWLGSCVGTICVFALIRKILNTKFFEKIQKKLESDKFYKISSILERKGFVAIFAFYAIPFLPSSLLTVTASICKLSYKIFIPPMMFGKFLMMFVVSYVGSDISGFLHSPFKIIVVTAITIVTYYIASVLKRDLEANEENAKAEYNRYITSKKVIGDNYLTIDKNRNFLVKQYYFKELIKMVYRILCSFVSIKKNKINNKHHTNK